ncbi:MAG: glycosyltransferase family 2 protein [Eubacteriales bacterium]|nr:glycosyltransferase family 2 protein [Eubacteriales bacterium]
MQRERAAVICLTPVKNEEWIMERFLKAASLWADQIIVADQYSSDKTREICLHFSKVRLIRNTSEKFDESSRQRLLIEEARKIHGKKLLIALDADEFLTGNYEGTEEWEEMCTAEPGTVFRMKWPCIANDFAHYWWTEGESNLFAVMDDGTPHGGRNIHSIRLPVPEQAVVRELRQIAVMHFQYTDWERMKRKNLWYQCYERIHFPQKSVFDIYRMYHHMDVPKKMEEIPADWYETYERYGVELKTGAGKKARYWWDAEIERFVEQYGEMYFQYIDFPGHKNATLSYLRRTQFLWRYRYGRTLLRRMDKAAAHILQRRGARG